MDFLSCEKNGFAHGKQQAMEMLVLVLRACRNTPACSSAFWLFHSHLTFICWDEDWLLWSAREKNAILLVSSTLLTKLKTVENERRGDKRVASSRPCYTGLYLICRLYLLVPNLFAVLTSADLKRMEMQLPIRKGFRERLFSPNRKALVSPSLVLVSALLTGTLGH